jgi:hypothetical protein
VVGRPGDGLGLAEPGGGELLERERSSSRRRSAARNAASVEGGRGRGGVLVVRARAGFADHVQACEVPGARERGVGPFAGEVGRAAEHPAHSTVAPWAP